MSETKFGGKIVGHSENFRYHSENHVCENFAKFSLCNSEFFFFLEKQNKIINK